MFNILCFGDSNTYGYKPDKSGRFEKNERWSGRLEMLLGEDVKVYENGVCGRTTLFEDAKREGRRAVSDFPKILEDIKELDLIIIMLGTNDSKTDFKAKPKTIRYGILKLVEQIKRSRHKNAHILLISPIMLGRGVGEDGFDTEFCERSETVIRKLPEYIREASERKGCHYLAASDYVGPSKTDREHLDLNSHIILADVIADKIEKEIFNKYSA